LTFVFFPGCQEPLPDWIELIYIITKWFVLYRNCSSMEIIQAQISRIHKLRLKTVFLIFIILDIACIGMGMGVPIFNIVFGFLIGWYIARRLSLTSNEIKDILKQLLKGAFITASVTFVGMILIWGWSITLLRGSDTEIANFGIPMILYSPRASLIGWLILMILISPFLQLLATIFAGNLTLLSIYNKKKI
jgi:hypothetical protein